MQLAFQYHFRLAIAILQCSGLCHNSAANSCEERYLLWVKEKGGNIAQKCIMLLDGYAGCRPIICRVNRVASVPRKYMLTSTGITERRRPTTDMANEIH
jgi:hypothetical protein